MAVDPTSVGFSLVDIKVAPLNLTSRTYGTPARLEYAQTLGFSSETATSELMGYGMVAEYLAVTTHASGELSQGLIDFAAYAVMLGLSQSSSGAPGNVTRTLDVIVGGSGNPYFGLIGRLATLNNGDMHIGFAKCQLASIPSFTIEQNAFIMPSTEIRMLTPDLSVRKLVRYQTHETATEITNNFGTFFTGFFGA